MVRLYVLCDGKWKAASDLWRFLLALIQR